MDTRDEHYAALFNSDGSLLRVINVTEGTQTYNVPRRSSKAHFVFQDGPSMTYRQFVRQWTTQMCVAVGPDEIKLSMGSFTDSIVDGFAALQIQTWMENDGMRYLEERAMNLAIGRP